MTRYTDTPVYDEVFEEALSMAVEIDNMDQLTVLENMNSDTSPLGLPFHQPHTIPF